MNEESRRRNAIDRWFHARDDSGARRAAERAVLGGIASADMDPVDLLSTPAMKLGELALRVNAWQALGNREDIKVNLYLDGLAPDIQDCVNWQLYEVSLPDECMVLTARPVLASLNEHLTAEGLKGFAH